MRINWELPALLETLCRLPVEEPFTTSQARERGVKPVELGVLVAQGLIRNPVRGAYVRAEVQDTLFLRIQILRLLVPPDCVVTDRTAAWLWGVSAALAPGDHLVTPPVSVFAPPGRRLRNGLVDSGERRLAPGDVVEVEGLLVTCPLRTACDVARLLPRDHALAALDGLAALGDFAVEQLNAEFGRFKRYRGIVQARTLGPLVDPRSGSHSESVMRLRWIDAGLPKPECQIEIPAPDGGFFLLDMGLREHRFAGEYDGEEFHGDDEREHDQERREWARRDLGWTIVVARKDNLYGRNQDIDRILRQEFRALTLKSR